MATQTGIAVYPVSGGKNWGYGSRLPTRDDTVILDLGRMNRIVEVNEELGYVVVEPGVTFRQLYDELRARRSGMRMSVPGTTPDASVLGNAVERGLGFGPPVERFSSVADMQIVLATGEVVHTGFSRFAEARCAHVHRYGVGPALGGLFSQSNLGVVSAMTFWLDPKPAAITLLTFTLADNAALERFAPTLRRCVRPGLDVRLQNGARHRVTSRGETRGVRGWLAERILGSPAAWHGTFAIYAASSLEAYATYRRLVRELEAHPDATHIRHWGLTTQVGARALLGPLRRLGLGGAATIADMEASLWGGRPQDAALLPTYAAMGKQPGDDRPSMPSDRCGLIWLCPVTSTRGEDMRRVAELTERTTAEHGFVPQVNFRVVSRRGAEAIIGIVYDRDEEGKDARAMACHDDLFDALTTSGYLPYRLGVQSMSRLPPSSDDADAILARIKKVLDPEHIVAPGRYVADRKEPL